MTATPKVLQRGTFEQAFTTEPKLRRILWHKQQTVKVRATALQESFYPTTDIPYSAVVNRMANLLGIVDRTSVLAYLGRPQHETTTPMDQTVQYLQSGTVVRKRHNIRKRLCARKGYIESFGLGYVYVVNGEWFIHWNHTEQLTLQQNDEGTQQKQSIVNFSLSPMAAQQPTVARDNNAIIATNVETTERKKEEYSVRERNSESESNPNTNLYPLNALERALMRLAKEPRG